MIIANIPCETISLKTSLRFDYYEIYSFEQRVWRITGWSAASCDFIWTRTIVL